MNAEIHALLLSTICPIMISSPMVSIAAFMVVTILFHENRKIVSARHRNLIVSFPVHPRPIVALSLYFLRNKILFLHFFHKDVHHILVSNKDPVCPPSPSHD